MNFFERYLIELILLGGFFLAGPLARIIADFETEEADEGKRQDYTFIKAVNRVLFAALIMLWLLLFKVVPTLLEQTSAPFF